MLPLAQEGITYPASCRTGLNSQRMDKHSSLGLGRLGPGRLGLGRLGLGRLGPGLESLGLPLARELELPQTIMILEITTVNAIQ